MNSHMLCTTDFHPCTGPRPGAAAHLVLLPGWALPGEVFADLLPWLCARFHVTVIDLPGAGRNADCADAGSLEALAAAVVDVAPLQAHWLGWSLGGMVAACVAANEPHRVRSLVVLATNFSFVQRSGWPAAMSPATFAEFAGDLARDPAATFERFLALQCQGGTQARDDLRRLRALVPSPRHPERLPETLAVLRDADLRQQIVAGIACPSLWLFGAADALVPAAAAEAVARRLPSARVAVLPGMGHLPFFGALAPVIKQLEAFPEWA